MNASTSDDVDEYVFNPEISKALMVLACKYPSVGNIWNVAMNDNVPLHFDNYKPFLTACRYGNLDMIKWFRRFQYDDEDGSKMIPDEIWKNGADIAMAAHEKDTHDWIINYLENETDEEYDTSSLSSQSDDYNVCCENPDVDCDDTVVYEETRKLLKEIRAQKRKSISSLK
jgi:hypothetical protein